MTPPAPTSLFHGYYFTVRLSSRMSVRPINGSIQPLSIISHESRVVSQMVLAFNVSESHMLTSLSSSSKMRYTSNQSFHRLPEVLLLVFRASSFAKTDILPKYSPTMFPFSSAAVYTVYFSKKRTVPSRWKWDSIIQSLTRFTQDTLCNFLAASRLRGPKAPWR